MTCGKRARCNLFVQNFASENIKLKMWKRENFEVLWPNGRAFDYESKGCRFDPDQDQFFFLSFWSSSSLLFCTFLGCYKLNLKKLLVGIVTLCSVCQALPSWNLILSTLI